MILRSAPAGAVALGLAVVLAGCSAGTEQVSAPSAPPAPSASAAGPAPTPPASPSGRVIEVRYAGGEVTGVDARVEVDKGEPVVLRVTSDVAEQIHVHGYDVFLDLVPGVPAETTFTADLPGAYEVELHDAGRPLFQLRVA